MIHLLQRTFPRCLKNEKTFCKESIPSGDTTFKKKHLENKTLFQTQHLGKQTGQFKTVNLQVIFLKECLKKHIFQTRLFEKGFLKLTPHYKLSCLFNRGRDAGTSFSRYLVRRIPFLPLNVRVSTKAVLPETLIVILGSWVAGGRFMGGLLGDGSENGVIYIYRKVIISWQEHLIVHICPQRNRYACSQFPPSCRC